MLELERLERGRLEPELLVEFGLVVERQQRRLVVESVGFVVACVRDRLAEPQRFVRFVAPVARFDVPVAWLVALPAGSSGVAVAVDSFVDLFVALIAPDSGPIARFDRLD